MEENQRPITHPSIFSAKKVIVTGGTFTQHNVVGNGRKSSFDILKEATAPNAFYDSGVQFDRPKCHPNTRIAVLKKIMDWARRCDGETWDKFILWLTGAAGAGKSAITQSFIEMCLLNDLVLASFIFWRSDPTRNHEGAFIATLAYQIYHAIPATQSEILSVIDADPLIFTKDLDRQFTQLVMKPLYNLCSGISSPLGSWRVIVIDGLDECGDGAVQSRILKMLAKSIQNFDLPILFLIASRPEHEIKTTFDSKPMNGVFLRLYLDDSFAPDEDIRTFLQDRFDDIRDTHPFKSQIPVLWPTRDDMESIILKSSGQFIYAATVIRYIESIRHQPHHRLEVIMNLRPNCGDLPFSQLDALYTMILSSAKDKERVLYALSIYSHDVFDGDNICGFLSLEYTELEILFCDLAALVLVECDPEANPSRLRILHKSLHDFLADPQRSKEYFIPFEGYRDKHIINIFRYITKSINYDIVAAFGCIHNFFGGHYLKCNNSAELMQLVSEFPLEKVFNAMMYSDEFIPAEFIFFKLCAFLNRMASLDTQWTLVEKRQQEALDRIFLSQMPFYHKDSYHIALLCFVCHAGKDILIPGIYRNDESDEIPNTYIWDNFFDSMECKQEFNSHVSKDTLKLYMNISDDFTSPYRNRVMGFLQNADRSGRYALGADGYTTAALVVIGQLQLLDWTLDEPVFDESDLDSKLTFEYGIWKLEVTEVGLMDVIGDEPPTVSEIFFLCLGYMIFFLPRSGRSELLIHYCQQETFLIEERTYLFPKRTTRARQAMKKYLKRFRDDGTSGED